MIHHHHFTEISRTITNFVQHWSWGQKIYVYFLSITALRWCRFFKFFIIVDKESVHSAWSILYLLAIQWARSLRNTPVSAPYRYWIMIPCVTSKYAHDMCLFLLTALHPLHPRIYDFVLAMDYLHQLMLCYKAEDNANENKLLLLTFFFHFVLFFSGTIWTGLRFKMAYSKTLAYIYIYIYIFASEVSIYWNTVGFLAIFFSCCCLWNKVNTILPQILR